MSNILTTPDYRQQLLIKAIRIVHDVQNSGYQISGTKLDKLQENAKEWNKLLDKYLDIPSDQGVI